MNGIICVNKPEGFTSFDVIAKLRGILKIRKLGHSGTLDPMATGVLPVFIGKATKACDMLMENEKSYLAGFKFGITTDTQDITGKVISEIEADIDKESLEQVFAGMMGKIEQLPPMYSAVSVNGQRLYDLARKGIEVERQPRKITVDKIELREFDSKIGVGKAFIACSKGTYVRTLIHDAGQALGCGAVMTDLIRLSSNGFKIEDCFTIDEIKTMYENNTVQDVLIPVEKIFSVLPELYLDEKQTAMYRNGIKLDIRRVDGVSESLRYAVYAADRQFIGTACADLETYELKVEKNF